jgi:hypothetical protein
MILSDIFHYMFKLKQIFHVSTYVATVAYFLFLPLYYFMITCITT